jgi:hypothetical protein
VDQVDDQECHASTTNALGYEDNDVSRNSTSGGNVLKAGKASFIMFIAIISVHNVNCNYRCSQCLL